MTNRRQDSLDVRLAPADLSIYEPKIHPENVIMELRPISEDAVDGAFIAYYVAMVYALANQPDLALEQLNSLVKIPGGELNYGDLKTAPPGIHCGRIRALTSF
jgi:hypothetical protein